MGRPLHEDFYFMYKPLAPKAPNFVELAMELGARPDQLCHQKGDKLPADLKSITIFVGKDRVLIKVVWAQLPLKESDRVRRGSQQSERDGGSHGLCQQFVLLRRCLVRHCCLIRAAAGCNSQAAEQGADGEAAGMGQHYSVCVARRSCCKGLQANRR